MAIKRTRKQKQQANLRHESVLTYSLDEVVAKKPNQVVNKQQAEKEQLNSIFDPSYLKKDLLKTFLVTALVVGVLIAYTYYQR